MHEPNTHREGCSLLSVPARVFIPTFRLSELYHSMFTSEERKSRFIFTANHLEVGALPHPLLVLAGKDMNHPTTVARELAAAAPHAEYVEKWRDEDHKPDVDARIEGFLAKHATCVLAP